MLIEASELGEIAFKRVGKYLRNVVGEMLNLKLMARWKFCVEDKETVYFENIFRLERKKKTRVEDVAKNK